MIYGDVDLDEEEGLHYGRLSVPVIVVVEPLVEKKKFWALLLQWFRGKVLHMRKWLGVACVVGFVGCATTGVPPVPPVPPAKTPSPVCAVGQTTGCWHQPPGQAWQFACPMKDWRGNIVGVQNVSDPAKCPGPIEKVSACPKPLAPGAVVSVKAKPWGQGFDASPYVTGDPEFCQKIHGVPANSCHLEGWPTRLECELELLGGCPEWEYRLAGGEARACLQPSAIVSCDHFGNTAFKDDPATPAFEGQPLECSNQRDPMGNPKAGFFIIAHGDAELRACRPDHAPEGCGPWVSFKW